MAATPPELSPMRSPVAPPAATGRRLSSFHTAKKPARHVPATPRRREAITPSRHAPSTPHRRDALVPMLAPNAGPTLAHTPGRRKSAVPAARLAADAAAHSSMPLARMSDSELAEMYSTTIKLCQDNKINAKNTWSLNLIDYMGMLVRDGTGGDEDGEGGAAVAARQETAGDTNFQIAGVTLDAGVRIYCSRVDSVHSNAFKVLGALSRTAEPNSAGRAPDAGEEGVGEGSEGDGEEGGRSRRRRKRGAHRSGGVTLEPNLEAITARKLETDLAVDPLFQQMSAAFDEGGARGMLLNNLSVGPRCEIVFDSGEPAQLERQGPLGETGATYSVTDVLPPARDPSAAPLTLCPRFLAFYRAQTAGAAAGGAGGASSASTAPFDGDGGEVDLGFEYGEHDMHGGDTLGLTPDVAAPAAHDDDCGFPGGFEDDDDAGVFGGRDSSISSRPSIAGGRLLMSGGVDLVEAGMALHRSSEYSFFDASALSSWAGPQHWRFRAVTASAHGGGDGGDAAVGGADATRVRKRSKGKTAMLLDYSSAAPDIDFEAEFAPPRSVASCQLSGAVQDGFSEKRVTLPDDLHFKTQTLATLFLKPKVAVVAKRRRAADAAVAESREDSSARGWYDFENDGDNDNFCPADEDDANAIFAFDDAVATTAAATGGLGGGAGDLVPEPTRVEKIDIGFATVAKKVDVRLLKSGMWTQLRAGAEDDDDDDDVDGQGVGGGGRVRGGGDRRRLGDAGGAGDDVRTGGAQTLQQVVQNISAFVPETSLPDVSLSYVFICLLHLANEKSLSIQPAGDGSLDDLVITSARRAPE